MPILFAVFHPQVSFHFSQIYSDFLHFSRFPLVSRHSTVDNFAFNACLCFPRPDRRFCLRFSCFRKKTRQSLCFTDSFSSFEPRPADAAHERPDEHGRLPGRNGLFRRCRARKRSAKNPGYSDSGQITKQPFSEKLRNGGKKFRLPRSDGPSAAA